MFKSAPPDRVAAAGIAVAVVALALAVLAGGVIMALAMGGRMDGMMGRGVDSSAESPVTNSSGDAQIAIRDFAFGPGNLSVPTGARVTWTNEDAVPHNATDRAGRWETDTLSKGESATLTFDTPGTYEYFCTFHPSMRATITVRQR